jgi:DNA-binding MarR family transcriptional regulator
MVETASAQALADALRAGIGLLVRRMRQLQPHGALTPAESRALAVLEREGPTTSSALARLEHITPQSMGVTVASLESRGLIERTLDPDDGRRGVLTVTRAGRRLVGGRRDTSSKLLADVLSANFTAAELKQLHAAAPLIERLARML